MEEYFLLTKEDFDNGFLKLFESFPATEVVPKQHISISSNSSSKGPNVEQVVANFVREYFASRTTERGVPLLKDDSDAQDLCWCLGEQALATMALLRRVACLGWLDRKFCWGWLNRQHWKI